MQRIIKLFTVISFATITSLQASACTGISFNGSGNIKPPTPPKPVPKDIKYYQNLIKQDTNTVNDFVGNIKNLAHYKNDKDLFPTPSDYIKTIAELQAEQASYQAQIYDSQYQILNLQTAGNFSPNQKLQAIKTLQNEVQQLTSELNTKTKYQTDYDSSELLNIKNQLNNVEGILNSLLNKIYIGNNSFVFSWN